jgi:transglutaminase-like putative cysteine protease
MALWSALMAKPQRTPLTSRPSLTLYFLLAGAFLLTLVPHVLQFPAWLTVVIVGSMILRSVIEVYRLPLPSTTFCGILAVILFGLTWVQFGTVMGRAAGTAVTAGLLAIKFYEIRQPRDIALIIFCCFFVVMSALLFSQVLELFIYCLIMMWILTALLLRVHAGDRGEDMLLHMLGRSGMIFLQALPLALLLFFFFPRLNGPLGLMLNEPAIGLTNHVAPGDIAKLSLDDTPAMYVHFQSQSTPLPESMYWRAVVLYDYRDGVFSTGNVGELPTSMLPSTTPLKSSGDIEQEITVRANNQRWLYALDIPVSKPVNEGENGGWADLYNDDTIRLNIPNKLDHFARYTIVSSQFRQQERINPEEYRASAQLPGKEQGPIDAGVVALANELYYEAGGDEDAYISLVQKYFHQNGFVYSINLEDQAEDWLPQFLLQRKMGYCEHFATAFAILMRQEGIHARLVAGYLGGDYNPYSDDWTVRQSNAHAWDEVWKPTDPSKPEWGRWIRIDPTASAARTDEATRQGSTPDEVSPIRVQQRTPTFADSFFPNWMKVGMREMQLRREELETDWDSVVLSYDTDTQFRMAQMLGFGVNTKFKLLLICVGAAAACGLAFWRWLARKPSVSPVEFLYAAFCRNMARRGIPRAQWEGPLAYTERVAEAFPDDTPALQDIGDIVARARYGRPPGESDITVKLETALARISASQAAGSRDKIRDGV